MPTSRILVVDDDPKSLSLLRRGLGFAGYAVDLAADGEEALALARENVPSLVILDLTLPDLDGLEVCRRLRQADPDLPVLMLTARDQAAAAGLDAGTDDYLVKPFAFGELLARVRALLLQAAPKQPAVLRFADLAVDVETREAERGGRPLALTTREYELLVFFLRHPRQVLSRDLIFQRVWGSDWVGDSNTIEVLVMRLREKLEAGDGSRLIQTVRGAGYVLRDA